MGIALAEASLRRGWPTTLLLGPTAIDPPLREENSQLRTIRFQTTADLQFLLNEHWPVHDVLFMAAAVADYRPKGNVEASERRNVETDHSMPSAPGSAGGSTQRDRKLRRGDSPLTLELEPTPDLLAELARTTRPQQLVIGFALEPADRLVDSAKEKLAKKQLGAIIANPLETMNSSEIDGMIFFRDGSTASPQSPLPKADFAEWLFCELDSQIRSASRSPAKNSSH
jgi:phosphopantothenoylcysteine decarboxylase/phosphopantothenate--cysteine ligase